AAGESEFLRVGLKSELRQSLAQVFGDSNRVGHRAALEQDCKFFSPQTAENGLAGRRRLVRDATDRRIADIVAVNVIDALETVDVEHERRQGAAGVRPRAGVLRVYEKGAPVKQAGQGIGGRETE